MKSKVFVCSETFSGSFMEEEESILISSDSSESDKPPAVLLDDSDLDFLPKTKLSDILGAGPSNVTFQREIPGPSWRVDVVEENPRKGCKSSQPPSKAIKRFVGDVPKSIPVIHALSDDEESSEPVPSRVQVKGDNSQSPHLAGSSEIFRNIDASKSLLHDGECYQQERQNEKLSENSASVDVQAHALSDSDADTVPADSPPQKPDFDHLFSTETVGPPDREGGDSSQSTLPPLDYLDNYSKSPTQFDDPIVLPKTAVMPKAVHDLSDSDSDSLPTTDSFTSVGTLPRPELDLQAHSEPTLNTTSYQISEFVSQTVHSQPLEPSGGTTKRKAGRPNTIDILERKRLKELALKEKKERAEAAARIRRLHPKECMKYISVEFHEDMASECSWAATILPILASSGIQYELAPSMDPCTVKWAREQDDSNVPEEEKHILFLWSTDRLVTCVKWGTLFDTFTSLKAKYDRYKVYLGIYDLHDYFKKASRSEKQRKNHDSGHDSQGNSRISKYEVTTGQIRLELCRLLTFNEISYKILNSPQEAAEFLQCLTQSIAELPFKLNRDKVDSERTWFVRGASKNCVRIDTEGNGVKQLWLQQLAQYNYATLDTAKAIAEIYPSPSSLYKAYNQCSSKKEQEKMLENILVRRGPGGAGRRLGPELSRKISIMFCQENGDILLK